MLRALRYLSWLLISGGLAVILVDFVFGNAIAQWWFIHLYGEYRMLSASEMIPRLMWLRVGPTVSVFVGLCLLLILRRMRGEQRELLSSQGQGPNAASNS
jgi:hypothetical protein